MIVVLATAAKATVSAPMLGLEVQPLSLPNDRAAKLTPTLPVQYQTSIDTA